MKQLISIIVVGALVGFLIWDFTQNEPVQDVADKRTMLATNFELPTLAGDTVELADARGKITIINFWASWCEPCKYEAPHLQKFYEENKKDVEILAVNLATKDKVKDAEAFVDFYRLTFPILLDKKAEVSTMYGAFTIPTTIFLNEKGEIVQQYSGPMEEQFLQQVVQSIR